jgi:hypothetical protein
MTGNRAAAEFQQATGHPRTQRYMHLSPAALDAAIQLLDGRGNMVASATVDNRKSNG